jgi:hypothetical protein
MLIDTLTIPSRNFGIGRWNVSSVTFNRPTKEVMETLNIELKKKPHPPEKAQGYPDGGAKHIILLLILLFIRYAELGF